MADDFPLDRDGVRKALKAARKSPMGFGYNPGTTDDDDEWFAAHRRRKPEFLGKMALTEGAGTKSAFGTYTVLGAELRMTCQRTIPQLARRFKVYLKSLKLTLNVVVLDPEGNVIDSDIEELDGWFDEDDDGAEDDGADAGAPAEAPPVLDPAVELRALTARLAAVKGEVVAAQGDLAPRIRQGFAKAVELVKAGKPAEADPVVSRLEMVLARLAHLGGKGGPAAAQPAQAPKPAGKAAPRPAAPAPQPAQVPPPASPAARIGRASEILRAAVRDMPGGRGFVSRIEAAEAQAARGQAAAAAGALRGLHRDVAEARRAQKRWDGAARIAAPLVARVLEAGNPDDAEVLRLDWQMAVDFAEAGAHDLALGAMPGIVAQLRAAAAA